MTEAIRGDIITDERWEKDDISIYQTDKGGLQYRAVTYLDVLLENKIITEKQWEFGHNYWGLRELAWWQLRVSGVSLETLAEYSSDTEEPIDLLDSAEPGMSTEIYRALVKRLNDNKKFIINSACSYVPKNLLPHRFMIVKLFGEHGLKDAFKSLEKAYPPAKEEAEIRMARFAEEINSKPENISFHENNTCV